MKKITKQEFERRIKVRFPEESFEIIEYDSLGQPAIIKCCQCGNDIKVSKASNFLAPSKAYGCVNCHGLWRQREEKLNKVKELYDIIGTRVVGTHTYYKIKCKQCGHVRETDLNNIARHLDCGCKTGVYRGRTAEEFINEVNKNSTDGKYILMSEYKDQLTKVLLKHTSCGFIWSVRPSDVIFGRSRCPKCGVKESKGSKFVTKELERMGIAFQKEYPLSGSKQRFDFYIESKGHKIAIEYQGEQHYKENNYFSTTLAQQQERDNRKRVYCQEHGIILIEIPYTLKDKEITKVLEDQVQRLVQQ